MVEALGERRPNRSHPELHLNTPIEGCLYDEEDCEEDSDEKKPGAEDDAEDEVGDGPGAQVLVDDDIFEIIGVVVAGLRGVDRVVKQPIECQVSSRVLRAFALIGSVA